MTAGLVVAVLAGCAVDPSDCRFFRSETCVPWRPAGLDCGLAHQEKTDPCPGDDTLDTDGNGVPNACQERYSSDGCGPDDADGDGVGDFCDRCEGARDADDTDGDGVPDDCDPCPWDLVDDADGDGVCSADDRESGVRSSAHWGGSCRADPEGAWFDPALEDPSTGVVRARSPEVACPSGHSPFRVSDHEGGSSGWATCEAVESSGSTRITSDLPEGAVCGLSRLGGIPHACEGSYFPSEGSCPPQFELRWVPDLYVDGVDDRCQPDTSIPSMAFDVLVYCALVEDDGAGGCTGEACDERLAPGTICGLHARGASGGYVPDPATIAEPPLRDLGDFLDYLLAEPVCPQHTAILPMRALLAEAADVVPTCMGRPVEEGCPASMELVCTFDLLAETDAVGPNVLPSALCWCGPKGSRQGEPPPCTRRGAPCVWGGTP